MRIEYKVDIEKDDLAIALQPAARSFSSNGAMNNNRTVVNRLPAMRRQVNALAPANPLANLSAKDVAAGPHDETAGPHDETAGPHDETAGPHDETAGPHDETAGVKGQGSAPIFIFGPVIFAGGAPVEIRKPLESVQPEITKVARAATA